MKKPIITERFCDNGELSHYELIEIETGSVLWSSFSEETEAVSNNKQAKEICSNCKKDMTIRSIAYGCKCGTVRLT